MGKGDGSRPFSVTRDEYYRRWPLGRTPFPRYRDGEPCGHPGCLSHVTHPCEGCGRIGGQHEPQRP